MKVCFSLLFFMSSVLIKNTVVCPKSGIDMIHTYIISHNIEDSMPANLHMN